MYQSSVLEFYTQSERIIELYYFFCKNKHSFIYHTEIYYNDYLYSFNNAMDVVGKYVADILPPHEQESTAQLDIILSERALFYDFLFQLSAAKFYAVLAEKESILNQTNQLGDLTQDEITALEHFKQILSEEDPENRTPTRIARLMIQKDREASTLLGDLIADLAISGNEKKIYTTMDVSRSEQVQINAVSLTYDEDARQRIYDIFYALYPRFCLWLVKNENRLNQYKLSLDDKKPLVQEAIQSMTPLYPSAKTGQQCDAYILPCADGQMTGGAGVVPHKILLMCIDVTSIDPINVDASLGLGIHEALHDIFQRDNKEFLKVLELAKLQLISEGRWQSVLNFFQLSDEEATKYNLLQELVTCCQGEYLEKRFLNKQVDPSRPEPPETDRVGNMYRLFEKADTAITDEYVKMKRNIDVDYIIRLLASVIDT